MRLTLTLLPLLLLAACDSADPDPTRTDLITSSAWVPRAPDAVPVSSPAQYEFRTDGTLLLTFDEGTEEERWSLDEEDTVLVVRDGEATRRLTILELTETSLTLEEIPAVAEAEPRRYELVHP